MKPNFWDLELIILQAIKDEDINKLKYIGQTLDCLLFEREFQYLWPLFRIVNDWINNQGVDMLSKLKNIDYPDLNDIGIFRCSTFDGFNIKLIN